MGNWTNVLLFPMLYLGRAHALTFIYVPYFIVWKFLLAPIFGVIQIGTISIEAWNRNSQLDIYIKSLSNGYQPQLIIKISIKDSMYHK